MALLHFEVQADYDEVIRLRKEIDGLREQIKSLNGDGALRITLEKQLQGALERMNQLTEQAALSGAKINKAFQQMNSIKTGLPKESVNSMSALAEGGDGLAASLGLANQSLSRLMGGLDGLGPLVGRAFGVGAIGAFLTKVEQTRSYFQDIESSMRVFLGDAEKADAFTQDLKDYAYYNMFDFAQLAQGSKELIAYGNATKDVIPILDKLSNVATGTGASLGELIALYDKAKSTGRVMARDVQSWAAKGVVLKDELKAMGVETSGTTVTFNQLNQVLEKVTGEGGRFHNLMLEQMDNLSASSGQLKDNLDAMYNEIGEKLQPLFKGTIDTASWLVDNYQRVGEVILTLANTYGVYRTILGIAHSIQQQEIKNLQEIRNSMYAESVATDKTTKSKLAEVSAHRQNVEAIKEEIKQKRKNAETDRLNALSQVNRSEERIKTLEENIAYEKDLQKGLSSKQDKTEADYALNTQSRHDELELNDKLFKEEGILAAAKEKAAIANEVLTKAEAAEAAMTALETTNTNLLTLAKEKLMAKLAPLKAALTNPYVLAAVAIGAAAFAIYKVVTAESEEEKAIRKVSEAMEEHNGIMKENGENARGYINTIKDTTKSFYEQYDAFSKLVELYPELNKSIDEIRSMDMSDLTKELSAIDTNRSEQHLRQQISSRERMIEEYEKTLEEYAYSDVDPNWEATRRNIRVLRLELAEFNKENKKFIQARLAESLANMSFDERSAYYEGEVTRAEAIKHSYDEIATKMNDLAADESKTNSQRVEEGMGVADAQVKSVDDTIAEIKKKIKDANSDEEKMRLQMQLTEYETLKTKLEGIRGRLQNWLNGNPLKLAFDVQGMGEGVADDEMKAMQKEIDKIAKDKRGYSSDAERSQAIQDIYDKYIQRLLDKAKTETGYEQGKALQALASQLQSRKNSGIMAFSTGMDLSTLAEDSAEAADNLEKISKEQSTFLAQYESFSKRMENAHKGYNEALRTYNEINAEYKAGKKTQKEMENAQEELNTAKSGYESLLKEANKYSKQIETERKARIKTQRALQDQEMTTRQSGIKAMRDGADKEIAQIRLDFEKRKQAIERGYEDIMETRLSEAQAAFNARVDKVGEFDTSGFIASFQYTEEDMAQKTAQEAENLMTYLTALAGVGKDYMTEAQKKDDRRLKVEEDILAIEQSIEDTQKAIQMARESGADAVLKEGERTLKNLNEQLVLAKKIKETLGYDENQVDYYKQYGTPSQQRRAIQQEYEYNMALEQDPYKQMALGKERDKALNDIVMNTLKQQVDWAGAMKDFGGEFREYSKQVYDAVQKVMQDPSFRDMDASDQKAYIDMADQLGNIVDTSFSGAGEAINAFKIAMQDYTDKTTAVTLAQANVQAVLEAFGEDSNEYRNAFENLATAEKDLEESHTTLTIAQNTAARKVTALGNAFAGAVDALSQLQAGTLSGIRESMASLATAFDSTKLAALAADPVTKAILALFDMLMEQGLDGIIDGIIGSLSGIVQNIAGGIVKRFTLDGELPDWMKTQSQLFDELADKTRKLVSAYDNAIGMLLEEAGEASGFESIAYYRQAQDMMRKRDEKQRELIGQQLDSDAKSTGRKVLDTISGLTIAMAGGVFGWKAGARKIQSAGISREEQLWNDLDSSAKAVLATLGVTSYGDLVNMDYRKLIDIQRNHADVWAELDDDMQDYLNDLIASGKEAEEMLDQMRERILSMSFDDMYNEFSGTLMRMDTTAYDMADNMSEYFYNAIMSSMAAEQFREPLKKLYDSMAADLEEDGKVDNLTQYQEEYNRLVKAGLELRDSVAEMTGYDEANARQQQRQGSSFEAMTHDQGDALQGLFTALHLTNAQIKDSITRLENGMQTLVEDIGGSAASPIGHMVSRIQDQLAASYLELVGIRENTGALDLLFERNGYMRGVLEQIRDNTARLK